MNDFGVITAASEKFSSALMAMVRSIRRNWSHDIPITVFDLGLDASSIQKLETIHAVSVRRVPEFCPHWRKHYTWKLWAIINCEYREFLWIDAGVFVMRPLSGVVRAIKEAGLFLVPNYQDLANEAPVASVYSAGLTFAQIQNRSSVSANIMGINRSHEKFSVFEEAYRLALDEVNISATTQSHRHDQALISCVLYSKYPDIVFFDGRMYAGWSGPSQVVGQSCWGHRRRLLERDRVQLELLGDSARARYFPRDPARETPLILRMLHALKIRLGRYVKNEKIIGIR